MGKIKKILENELVGGTQSTDVYPITSVKAVYNENNERLDNIIKEIYSSTPTVANSSTESDLDISDEDGNVLVRCKNGHIQTQKFNSETDGQTSVVNGENADLDISDEQGNVLAEFKGGHVRTKNFDSRNRNKMSIKLMAIGNSYARDAYSYVPYLLQSIIGEQNIDITFGIIYLGSCALQTHWNNIVNNNSPYEYDKWTNTQNKWVTTPGKSILSIIQDEDWDIITLQQQSSRSRDYRTMQPYLNNIINWLFSHTKKSVRLGWLMTPSYPEGYSNLSDDYGFGRVTDTSDSMYEKICVATKSVLDNTAVDFAIPVGTSIQNARTTSLDSLGDFGHLSAEGIHLQEGIPCLLEAYVVTNVLLSYIGKTNLGIYGDTVRPTQANVVAWNIPQRNGNSVGVTEENVALSQKIVSITMKKPYEITDCSIIFEQ